MTRLKRGGWPYSHPINTPFDINRASPQATGLVAWWPALASAGGNVLRDLSGHGNDGIVTTASWTTTRYGPALDFDGVNDFVTVAHSPSLNISTDKITLVALVYPDDADALFAFLGKPHNAVHGDPYFKWLIARAPGAVNRQAVLRIDSTQLLSGVGNQIPDGQWSHIAGVYDGSNMYIYINGTVRNSVGKVGNIQTSTEDVFIGQNVVGGERFDGRMPYARVYNVAKTDAEIYQMYINPWELYRPLVRWWAVKGALIGVNVPVLAHQQYRLRRVS